MEAIEKPMERKETFIVRAGRVSTGETPDTVGEDLWAAHSHEMGLRLSS